MKTCGECAWFAPDYTINGDDGSRTEVIGGYGVCRRAAWGENRDTGLFISYANRQDRCCPAFEEVPVEIPKGQVALCMTCGKPYTLCNHVEGYTLVPKEGGEA